MSARSAQRTRRRRWRMGRDRAGERERDENSRATSGLEALVIEGGQRRLLLLPPFALRRSFERRSASHPAVFPSTIRFHGPHRVWIRFRGFLPLPVPPTADWIIWTAAAAAAGQTITRTTDETELAWAPRRKPRASRPRRGRASTDSPPRAGGDLGNGAASSLLPNRE